VVLATKHGLYEMSMPDDDQHSLKILRVKSGDLGQLMCVASNKFGSDSCIFSVEMAGECNNDGL
jgi:serine/threonine protein kinase